MAELGNSTPGSQSQMTSMVTEPVNEDTLKNTQVINQPENILHEITIRHTLTTHR
jgi:hypothetical protein